MTIADSRCEATMTMHDERARAREELERLLDTHGGDEARWPAAVKTKAGALSAKLPEARQMLAGAKALDRLIDAAPSVMPSAERALADRIMAAAMAETAAEKPAARTGQVIQLPIPGRGRGQAVAVVPRRMAVPQWQATGALMAASLLIGILLGGYSQTVPLLQDVAQAVGIGSGYDTALADDASEEDAL